VTANTFAQKNILLLHQNPSDRQMRGGATTPLTVLRRFGRMINSSGRAIIRPAPAFLYSGAFGTAIQSSHHVERRAFSS
jgi:hypothetical protein